MEKKKISTYEVLVYIAYSFFLLIGLVWFLVSWFKGGHFNATAFFIIAAFASQFYFRHRLTNLILGILALFFSIFMLLDVINEYNLMAKDPTYGPFVKVLLAMSLTSIIMSGILVFSFSKLSFKHQGLH